MSATLTLPTKPQKQTRSTFINSDVAYRQKILQRFENVPVFTSFAEEIEWRLWILSILFESKKDHFDCLGTAKHWIRVAQLAGYTLNSADYLVRKTNREPLFLSKTLRNLWNDLLVDNLTRIREQQTYIPKTVKKAKYYCFDSNGVASLLEAVDLFEIVEYFCGVELSYDEKKRCSRMLEMGKYYKFAPLGITLRSKKSLLVLTYCFKETFVEVVIKKQED